MKVIKLKGVLIITLQLLKKLFDSNPAMLAPMMLHTQSPSIRTVSYLKNGLCDLG